MNRYVTREEQDRLGLIKVSDRNGTRYVPAQFNQDTGITSNEQIVLSQAVQAAGDIIGQQQLGHQARSDDTAVTQAVGSLIYSLPYLAITALITGGLLVIGWLFLGGDERFYLMFWLVAWGACSLYYLSKNREQGLHHSAAGIAHHEIDIRAEVAKYAIDRHIDLLEKKWKLQS